MCIGIPSLEVQTVLEAMRESNLSRVVNCLTDVAIDTRASPSRETESEKAERFIIDGVGCDAVALPTGVGNCYRLGGTCKRCEERSVNPQAAHVVSTHITNLHCPSFS